jgi:hypothetical protein
VWLLWRKRGADLSRHLAGRIVSAPVLGALNHQYCRI